MAGILSFLEMVQLLELELGPILSVAGKVAPFAFVGAIAAEAQVNPFDPQGTIARLTAADVAGARKMGEARFNAFVSIPTGLASSPQSPDLQAAVAGIEAAMGQGPMSALIAAAFGSVFKAITGNRAPDNLVDGLASIPDKMGLPNFCASMMHDLYQMAFGQTLQDHYNERYHPRRLDQGTLYAASRAGILTPQRVDQLLNTAGYDAEARAVLSGLQRQGLAIGELQVAYEYGLLSEQEILARFEHMGFTAGDAQVLVQVYLKRIESTGGDYLRNVARGATIAGTMTLQQFKAVLEQVNVPEQSIALEVAGVQLERGMGQTQLSVSQLKAAYQSGVDSREAVLQALQAHDYAPSDAQTLVQTWDHEAGQRLKHISEQRILQYYESGIFSAAQAFDQLRSGGLNAADANILIAHPEARPPHLKYPLTKDTVLLAYKDGAITVEEAQTRLAALGVAPQEATLSIQIAQFQMRRKPPKPTVPKQLTEQQIFEAYALKLVSTSYVETWLKDQGWTDGEASLLTAIQVAKYGGGVPDSWFQLQ
jgi:hypothetical protein